MIGWIRHFDTLVGKDECQAVRDCLAGLADAVAQ